MELLLDLAELLARRLVAELHPLDAILQLELETKIREVVTIMIKEKSPGKAFSWLIAPSSAFTLKILLRRYATRTL